MTSPIIQPGRLTFHQSPPSGKESVDTCENIGVDLDRISTNIADKLNISSKSTKNTEAKEMDTSKMSIISDGKPFDDKSRDVEVKPKIESKLGKMKAELSNQSQQLRQKLRSFIVIPRAYQDKKASEPEVGIESVVHSKVSMEKEEEGGMTGYEDETIRNANISSQQAKPQIISDTTRNMVQRKSLSEVISETNLFSDTECGNGVLSSSKELNGDCGITICHTF